MPTTPCQSDPDRWAGKDDGVKHVVKDDRAARALCWTQCYRRAECALDGLKEVAAEQHPLGIYGGVFLPDDNQYSDDPNRKLVRSSMLKRRGAIEFLRSTVVERNTA